ncbi:MAG: hypothetical protein KJ737_22975 [Proteobacteria bacterium]|nr:hypothetical protein [Pseudomonadota bacterium]
MDKMNMEGGFTIECNLGINKKGDQLKTDIENENGRVPRLSRLMALAIHFDNLIKSGTVRDFADIAKLGYVSRARVTQIMNLNLLAPVLQEKILFLPEVENGRDPLTEHLIRKIAAVPEWPNQLKLWKKSKMN